MFPSVGMTLALSLGYPMVFLALIPFGVEVALFSSILLPSVLIAVMFALAPVVSVSSALQAGRFKLPLEAIGAVEKLTQAQMRELLGPGSNPAARLMIRGYIKAGIKVEIADPEDSTPYVLISSRNPARLASALDANGS